MAPFAAFLRKGCSPTRFVGLNKCDASPAFRMNVQTKGCRGCLGGQPSAAWEDCAVVPVCLNMHIPHVRLHAWNAMQEDAFLPLKY